MGSWGWTANSLSRGDVIRLSVLGIIQTKPDNPGTLRFQVQWPPIPENIVADSGPITLPSIAEPVVFNLTILITVREIGANGQVRATGTFVCPNSPDLKGDVFFTSDRPLDTTADRVMTMTIDFSVADPANALVVQQSVIEWLKNPLA